MIMQARAMRDCSHIAECSLSYAMIMQMSGIRACSYLPECSLSYTMTVQSERSSKAGKRSFTRLDTAEPMPVICNDNANEGNERLLLFARVQPVICKDNIKYFILLLP